ncbi:MAG: heme-binding domain-containing protein [Ferruginibacter sp.]
MKRLFKVIFYTLLIAFVLLQFYPKPGKNLTAIIDRSDIAIVHNVPLNVQSVLKTSCFNCHSNNTIYPWYSRVQPFAHFLGDHIYEGKKELNFSEFGKYGIGKQYRKLEEAAEQIDEDDMPLTSYTLIHSDAKLNKDKKLLLSDWIATLRDSIRANYPADSLIRKKR